MGKSTISMVIFNSYATNYQRVMITQWIWDSPFSEPFQPTGLTGGYGWWPNDCWFQSGEDVMQEYSGNDQRFGDHRFRYSSFSHLFTTFWILFR